MTDPLTVITICAALAIPPTQVRTKREPVVSIKALAHYDSTIIVTGEEYIPQTQAQPTSSIAASKSQREQTLEALEAIKARPAGGNSALASDAIMLVINIPGFFPIPKVAESEAGDIALFWEMGNFYADLEIHGNGLVSAFRRFRENGKNTDSHLVEISLEQQFGKLFYEFLLPLAPMTAKAA